jgi:hypothetical protein
MNRAVLVLLLAGALAAAGCANAEGGGSTTASRRPSIIVVAAPPMAVRGTGFKARERVTVTVRATGSARKQVVASSGGAFTVRFQNVDPSACAGLSITAVGNRGSRADFKRSPGLCPRP